MDAGSRQGLQSEMDRLEGDWTKACARHSDAPGTGSRLHWSLQSLLFLGRCEEAAPWSSAALCARLAGQDRQGDCLRHTQIGVTLPRARSGHCTKNSRSECFASAEFEFVLGSCFSGYPGALALSWLRSLLSRRTVARCGMPGCPTCSGAPMEPAGRCCRTLDSLEHGGCAVCCGVSVSQTSHLTPCETRLDALPV